MKPTALVLALILALAAPVSAQEWAGRGRLQGVIKSADGKPIANARVVLRYGQTETGPEPLTTNVKGRWSILGIAHGQWLVLVDADGYVGAQGSVRVYESGPGQSLDIELRKPSREELAQAAAAERGSAVEKLKKGNSLIEARQYAAARAEYEAALSDLPPENHAPVLRAIANSWYAEGDVDQALATFDRALAQAPDDAELLQAVVNVLAAAGREAEAQKYLARLPADAELNPATLLNFGIEAYNAGEMGEAFEHFDRLIKQKPDYPDSYYYRGLVNLNNQNSAAAAADFKRFLELIPADHAELLTKCRSELEPGQVFETECRSYIEKNTKAAEARDFLAYLEP